MITPRDFVDRWGQSALRENQGAQSHFNELCQLVNHKTPTQLDPQGEFFTFEENVEKATGGRGRADVWYKDHFAWEYKGKHIDLDAAYAQLLSYRGGLGNPPLLVVSDFLEYRIYPQWVNTSGQPFIFHNEDLLNREAQNYILWLLEDPEKFLELRQSELQSREQITLSLANRFAHLADLMRTHTDSGWTAMQIARFLTKLVFGLFAEDVDLLPRMDNKGIISYIAENAADAPEGFRDYLTLLFQAMNGERGDFLLKPVPYFNGGLFADSAPDAGDGLEVLDITQIPGALNVLREVSEADWRAVNPTIFGTLFEGALDAGKRAQLGAHYTGENDIRLVIEPVLMNPLYRLWDEVRAEAEPLLQTYLQTDAPRPKQEAYDRLAALRNRMLAALGEIRVLDPACGSGNFLYMSLRALKDLEGRVHTLFEPLDLPFLDVVTPRQLYGIEKDEFAARLAHVVVWIGYLQWRYENEGGRLHFYNPRTGTPHPRQLPNPIIQDKVTPDEPERIVNDDAIMRYNADGKPYEPDWPEVDVIVGNPPFLGGNRIRAELGDYVDDLFKLYDERVPAFADLVCYWYEKARAQLAGREGQRAGLLATNSIRGGVNRQVLERIKQSGDIFMAWSDRAWTLDGAAVRVSIVGFTSDGGEEHKVLDGESVITINADLTASVDITKAGHLAENESLSFMGPSPKAPFDIDDKTAQLMIAASNASHRDNADVVRPVLSAVDIVRMPRREWTIYFGTEMAESDASLYELPFQYVKENVLPARIKSKQTESEKQRWWLYARPRPEMQLAISGLLRFIATPAVAKHRIFVWVSPEVICNQGTLVFAREDDYFFGVLHSYSHEIWALRLGTSLEDRPRYTPTTTFETFPFPWPPGQEDTESPAYAAISSAAKQLHEEREVWLNPPDLISLGAGSDSPALRERTLTNLYNAVVAYRTSPPAPSASNGEGEKNANQTRRNGERIVKSARDFAPRLAALHDTLDRAVLAAYGWDDIYPLPPAPSPLRKEGEQGEGFILRTAEGDEEVLRRLLVLNLERAGAGE